MYNIRRKEVVVIDKANIGHVKKGDCFGIIDNDGYLRILKRGNYISNEGIIIEVEAEVMRISSSKLEPSGIIKKFPKDQEVIPFGGVMNKFEFFPH